MRTHKMTAAQLRRLVLEVAQEENLEEISFSDVKAGFKTGVSKLGKMLSKRGREEEKLRKALSEPGAEDFGGDFFIEKCINCHKPFVGFGAKNAFCVECGAPQNCTSCGVALTDENLKKRECLKGHVVDFLPKNVVQAEKDKREEEERKEKEHKEFRGSMRSRGAKKRVELVKSVFEKLGKDRAAKLISQLRELKKDAVGSGYFHEITEFFKIGNESGYFNPRDKSDPGYDPKFKPWAQDEKILIYHMLFEIGTLGFDPTFKGKYSDAVTGNIEMYEYILKNMSKPAEEILKVVETRRLVRALIREMHR